ncbi:Cof-type HAD-IIB family hydrolase [Macrococcus epidermidis]|uniref:Cof-type HAD-IIB family hydrolase n=1 Tax=Macrococcus epidermidis TaxID=1902580 RepID=A0A327ZVJ2_9STAP|nr:Cof-type HAD-IIB family hydrolase [Macrococcus epidermidis]RAK46331.1 Cof-type HAD-IIB family hydrolase [Macrococcus epidermidis]UTH17142.1 Cof-type HAD-IIB family hydrolase [Macrococcus epidermidis]
MKRHLIFFDIDGTLYNDDKEMSEHTKETIRKLQENGHILAIATGRAPFMLQEVIKETGITNYISFNGQYAVMNGEVIYENPLDMETLKQLEEDASSNNHPLVFLNELEMVSNIEYHEHIKKSISTLKFDHPRHEKNYYLDKPIYQTLIFNTEEEDKFYDDQYEKIKFIRWHEVSRDVVPVNGSKFEGIKKVSETLNIPIEDCIAVGDGLNDLEMIQGVGLGIVMGNGVDALKEVADYVTEDVHEEGLTNAFKHFKLID